MQQTRPSTTSVKFAAFLMAAGLVTVPFDAVRGIGALGELSNELSFPFFGASIGLLAFASIRNGEAHLRDSLALKVGAAFLVVILISYASNAASINTDWTRGRAALPKFATSLLVILYGVGLAWLAEQVTTTDYRRRIARFIAWSALIAIAYALFELAGHSFLRGPFEMIDTLIHPRKANIINSWDGSVNQKVLFGWDGRLRSVSFEPPAFGNYMGFAWPWLWFATASAPTGRKHWPGLLLAAFTATILLSQSRTGLLMLGINLIGLGALYFLYARPQARGEATLVLRMLLPAVVLVVALAVAYRSYAQSQSLVDQVVLGDSVSNLSRLAFQTAGMSIFKSNPVVGVGLGQFGFHVIEAMPSWGFLSPEVRPMVFFPEAPWPNVYNLYLRLAAELGIVGLIGWCVLWARLFFLLAARARQLTGDCTEILYAPYPIALNCLGVLASGIATDTFRTPMLWITLGLACAMIRTGKSRRTVALS